jgi:rSAM/selenodomain-associated transferase 2/rSAM/selenodomain-associated transferase 1
VNPTVSIIIPVYCEPFAISRCLTYLASCRHVDECEIIVVEGDRGASLVPTRVLPVRTVRTQAGRGLQLDAGASAARGGIFVFLHVDPRPPRGFVRTVQRTLRVADAGAFDLHIRTRNPVVRATSLTGLVRSRITRIPYGDQVHFVTREAYESVGGYPHLPIMEDVAFMHRIRRSGRRVVLVRPPARTSARRWEAEGVLRTTLRNWRIMLAYRAGIAPARLRSRYRAQVELETLTDHLLVFHRALRPGGVKTRLAADTGSEHALLLYRAMLADLAPATRLRAVRTTWFVDDPAAGTDFAGDSVPQMGDGIWERMADAIARAIAAGAGRVVLIGSDIPGIDERLLRSAFGALNTSDLVLGPSCDGGFHLIGFRAGAFDPEVFSAASAAPDRGAAAIAAWARDRGLPITLTPTLRDIDTIDDLLALLGEQDPPAVHLRRCFAGLARRGAPSFSILSRGENA